MKDVNIFGEMTLGDLLQDIYVGTMQKRNRINKIITLLEGMLNSTDDVAVIGPILNSTIDVLVKNDDHLIKVATIVQRIISAESYNKTGNDLDQILSDAEKEKLTKEALAELNAEVARMDREIAKLPGVPDENKNG